ncbi:SHOCT domain-containing protein [Thermomonospora amylolytica]|uniref:SHOCT domain-containing protein n=1 Tax=Thermomonospora amylolytica TaxID=1411117 RepID=UPI0018E50999|nr:SHOCT domain-containing protein [Thermomonospora amylolytica]
MMIAMTAHGPWEQGDPPAFWPVFPITFGLLWLAVLAAAGYLLWRRASARPAARAQDPLAGARTILAERFARGEIDEDEYHVRMSALRTEP